MLDQETLKTFCSTDQTRVALREPFVMSGWEYATNGRIAIRQPSDQPNTERPKLPKSIDTLGWGAVDRGDAASWPEISFETKMVKCEDCKGTGSAKKECSNCSGGGTVVCYHCESEYDCQACLGYGTVLTGGSCIECGGAGKVEETAYVKLAHQTTINGGYAKMIDRLPGEKMWAQKSVPNGLIQIWVGDDIEILLMPIRDWEDRS